MKIPPYVVSSLFVTAAAVLAPVRAEALVLQKDDHIAIVGSGLADRQQHHAWLETLIHKAHPSLHLTVRNLGFAADEVNLHPRSDEVPTTEYFLNMVPGQLKTTVGKTEVTYTSGADFHASVILAYWGFNESFRGEAGLADFKKNLAEYLTQLAAADYGKGRPRVVLFSPLAHEDLKSPHYSNGAANNRNLTLYTEAMAEVARQQGVQFVDLFKASQQLFNNSALPLTLNGIHLKEEGDKALAPIQFNAIFGKDAPDFQDTDALRRAIVEKNLQWHHRYRTVDQYNIFGGRSRIAYEGMTNAHIVGQELAQRDVLTANRDRVVWTVANGKPAQIKDDNLPPVDPTPPNRKEPVPYMSGEEAIKHLSLPAGCKVELVASEETFPELVNPVQMNFDTKGRLWIAAWPTYPETTPTTTNYDKLLVFDLDPKTGKAKKCTTFADGLNCPTGFQLYKDGVIVMQSPDLWFMRDTDGDGKADWKERILHGLDAADSHHETNSICYEPGGAIYLSDGVFHRTNVETFNGPVRNVNGAIYRFEPNTGKFMRHVPYGFANPHGRVFDYWGNDLVTDATGNANYFGPAFSGHLDSGAHPGMQQFWQRPSRPCPGTAILSSRHFPEDWQGLFLNTNVISIHGIFRAKLTEEGSGIKGETLEHLITTDIEKNPNFRPSGVTVAPDGSLYFMDWSQMLIGHLQHHLRDPNRDHQHGRLYRITYPERPLLVPKPIAGESVDKLVALLSEHENDVRLRAKIELGSRDSKEVIAAVQKWEKGLDKGSKTYEHDRLEALWVHQWHDTVNLSLLHDVLKSPEPRARAQAVRVAGYWRDRVPGAADIVRKAASDENMRVRLEAVRVASFFKGADVPVAIEAAFAVLKQPTDYYIEYCFKETHKQLRSLSSEYVMPSDPIVRAVLLEKATDGELREMPVSEDVLFAKVDRKSTDGGSREKAVQELAKLHGLSREAEIAALLGRLDLKGGVGNGAAEELGKLVATTTPTKLAAARSAFAKIAEKAAQAQVRRAAWGAMILADADAQVTWKQATDEGKRNALIDAIGFIADPGLRSKFQPILSGLLADEKLPRSIRAAVVNALPLMGPANAKAGFATLAGFLAKGEERTLAARAVMQLPRDSWDKAAAAPAVESLLAWAKTVPADKRTSQQYVETVQTAAELAGLLEDGAKLSVRKELRGLGVSVFVVKTVREQMRYDTPRIVVEAGKPFELIVENTDVMPHNLLVVAPGSRQAVSESVQTKSPTQLDKKGRPYVPEKDNRVLEATRLLEPGQKETLKMTAPRTPGEYEYVCTFPGHWMIMWGKLVVTKDVEDYLQKHPEAPQAPGVATAHGSHQHASSK
jgi:azurin/glucose/arabinose dehydrogenase